MRSSPHDRIAIVFDGGIMGIVAHADVDPERLGVMMAGENMGRR